MRVLIIRQKNCQYLKGFLSHLDKNKYELFILDLMNGEYCNYNKNSIIHLTSLTLLKKFRLTNYFLRYFSAFIFLIRFYNVSWDVCHILNIKRENFWLIPFLHNRTRNIIITIFGRSTYTNRYKRVLFNLVYKYVDFITFEHRDSLDEFVSYNKAIIEQKNLVLLYPLIEHLNYKYLNFFPKSQAIDDLGLNPNSLRISCSSTIASYDQHPEVIKSLRRLEHKNKVQLMFLLTYGGTDSEKNKIIDLINRELYEFDVKIFDFFLTTEQLIKYRIATDIYINMRLTDQLAGAVIESVGLVHY
jgi:hypothetical protein